MQGPEAILARGLGGGVSAIDVACAFSVWVEVPTSSPNSPSHKVIQALIEHCLIYALVSQITHALIDQSLTATKSIERKSTKTLTKTLIGLTRRDVTRGVSQSLAALCGSVPFPPCPHHVYKLILQKLARPKKIDSPPFSQALLATIRIP